jgi:cytochrome P450
MSLAVKYDADGNAMGSVTTSDLQSMEYTNQVLMETLRFFPSLPFVRGVSKRVYPLVNELCDSLTQEFKVEGVTVPSGVHVLASLYSTNHDENVYTLPGSLLSWNSSDMAQKLSIQTDFLPLVQKTG